MPGGEWGCGPAAPGTSRLCEPLSWRAMTCQSSSPCSFMLGLDCTSVWAPVMKKLFIESCPEIERTALLRLRNSQARARKSRRS